MQETRNSFWNTNRDDGFWHSPWLLHFFDDSPTFCSSFFLVFAAKAAASLKYDKNLTLVWVKWRWDGKWLKAMDLVFGESGGGVRAWCNNKWLIKFHKKLVPNDTSLARHLNTTSLTNSSHLTIDTSKASHINFYSILRTFLVSVKESTHRRSFSLALASLNS